MARVAVVVIARDDARGLERALLSVRPHVDDLVVLDLGSVDATVEVAEAAGARVVPARWSEDRAAVRNAALDLAGADWHVVLEPEEWLDDPSGLADLRERAPQAVGLVTVVSEAASRGLEPAELAARVLPGHVRYAGGHRESPLLGDLPTWRVGAAVVTDVPEPAAWRHDRTRAEAALLQALGLQPDDPRLMFQLASLQRDQGRLAEASELFAASLDGLGDGEPWRHQLVVEGLDTFRRARRFREAIALMDAETATWGHSPDFAFVVGDLFFEMILDDLRTAPQLAPLAAASWRRCIEIGERPDLAGAVHGRGSFLAAQNLGTLHLTLGDEAEAGRWWEVAGRLRLPRAEEALGPSAGLG